MSAIPAWTCCAKVSGRRYTSSTDAPLRAIGPLLRNRDLPPEGVVGVDLIDDEQHKSDDKPQDPDLQAVGTGGGVEDGEAVCRVCCRDQHVGIAPPGDTSEQCKDEQARSREC